MRCGCAGSNYPFLTQKERDNETGLDYFGARYYASTQGRFTSVDPVIFTEDRLIDPQRIALYGYSRNNPLKYTDPTGRDIKLDSKLKPADADRVMKTLVEAYRREKGREAIKTMAGSKIPFGFTAGSLKDKNAQGIDALGETAISASGREDSKGQVKELKVTGVTITLDLARIDSDGLYTDQDVQNHELYHGQAAANSPEEMYLISIGAVEAEFGLLEEKNAEHFAAGLSAQDPTMTPEAAGKEVRKLLGLPEPPAPTPPPSKPPPPAPAPTPPTKTP